LVGRRATGLVLDGLLGHVDGVVPASRVVWQQCGGCLGVMIFLKMPPWSTHAVRLSVVGVTEVLHSLPS
jgi:hypothetical protein